MMNINLMKFQFNKNEILKTKRGKNHVEICSCSIIGKFIAFWLR